MREDDGEEAEQNFMRTIYKFEIEKVSSNQNPTLDVYMAIIRGSAFLWHQVRYMMNVLYMIGRGDEEADCIDKLFDVDTLLERPNYDLADG